MCAKALEAFLATGGRKIDAWYAALKVVEVSFDGRGRRLPQTSTPRRVEGRMSIQQTVSCLDGYDPDALRVDKAREAILACLTPIAQAETVSIRDALGRVLAENIVPRIDVPAHDNSAMDGYAVRFSDLERPLKEIGTALAGKPFHGKLGAGECVRIMTGAVMPQGADTVVIQEVVKKDGERITVPPGQKKAQNVRYAGEDLKIGVAVLTPGVLLKPADIGLIASLGIGEVRVKRRLRVAFFATGDELASIGTALKEGEIYDSNRYTVHGMLARLGVEAIDLGVVRDDPSQLEKAFRQASEKADVVITTGGVSVGEADFIKADDGEARRSAVLEDRHAPGPADGVRQASATRSFSACRKPGGGDGHLLPVRARCAAASLRAQRCAVPPAAGGRGENLRKVPGRTEYQRGVLFKDRDQWKVRTTGQQGSGVLRSMSEANCFIVLEHERASVKAGEPVSVQLFEGLA
jgi:molybdopterin molybdotransferase